MNKKPLFNQRLSLIKQNGEGRINSSFAIVGSFPHLTPSTLDVLLYAESHQIATTMLSELEQLKSELPEEIQSGSNLSIKTVWLALGETEALEGVKVDAKWFTQFVNFLRSIQGEELLTNVDAFVSNLGAAREYKKRWIEQGLHYHYCASYYAAADALMTADEKNNPDLTLEDWAAIKVTENLHLLKKFRHIV